MQHGHLWGGHQFAHQETGSLLDSATDVLYFLGHHLCHPISSALWISAVNSLILTVFMQCGNSTQHNQAPILVAVLKVLLFYK